MVIWSHADAGYTHLYLLFILFGLIPLGVLVMYIRDCFLPAMREPGNRRPIGIAFFSVPIVILLILFSFALRLPLHMHSFFNAEQHILQGEVELISYAEDWGRNFNGYTVVLNVDGAEFTSLDTYPKDVVDRLAEGGQMQITYVELEGDGTYVWEIKSIP